MKQGIHTKTTLFFTKPQLLLAAAGFAALAGCSDDGPDFYRSSSTVDTDNLNVYVQAEVHTHLGETNEEDETHTTLLVEFTGYSKNGYYYSVELAEDDLLSAEVNGESASFITEAVPNANKPSWVYYYQDFDTIASGTEFTVYLDRERDAAIHSASVILPEESTFTITPADDTISLYSPMTIEWTESDEYEYALSFLYLCEDDTQTMRQHRVGFPNWNVETIASPFTFTPANFFSPNDPSIYTLCELHTSLKTYSNQDPAEQAPFAELSIRSKRQQRIEKVLDLTPP